jgi:hypothetical protein
MMLFKRNAGGRQGKGKERYGSRHTKRPRSGPSTDGQSTAATVGDRQKCNSHLHVLHKLSGNGIRKHLVGVSNAARGPDVGLNSEKQCASYMSRQRDGVNGSLEDGHGTSHATLERKMTRRHGPWCAGVCPNTASSIRSAAPRRALQYECSASTRAEHIHADQ